MFLTPTSPASPGLLPALVRLVPRLVAKFTLFHCRCFFYFDPLLHAIVLPSGWPFVVVVVVVVIVVVGESSSYIDCSPFYKGWLRDVLPPHAFHLSHSVFYQLRSLDHLSVVLCLVWVRGSRETRRVQTPNAV
ncbi:hypothetical protein Taro_041111 [Colocasia esculenta]|uniref:Uncharacterized protein n=1 Tax=Colocasia esculenta TaxID=4460 RepID=A0A843WKN8_COLES|nr:hypothetical protein [Colocasia esculenta]